MSHYPYSSIHPVFHVSLLKKAVSPLHSVSPSLPDTTDELQVPIAVLDSRLHRLPDKTVPELLIHQSNSPPTLATWEDEITVTVSSRTSLGSTGSQGRRDVTSSASTPTTQSATAQA